MEGVEPKAPPIDPKAPLEAAFGVPKAEKAEGGAEAAGGCDVAPKLDDCPKADAV